MAEGQSFVVRRCVTLVLACLVIAVSGTTSTFTNYATHLKNEFELNQQAVEVIAAIRNVGGGLGYPVGLFYERFGSSRSFFLALLLTGVSMTLLYTTQFAIAFYHTEWIFLGLYLFIFGCGSIFMGLAPTSICAHNFPGHVRGAIMGLTQSCKMLGPALFGKIYVTWFNKGSIGSYFIFLAVLCVVMNLFSIWMLRPINSYNESDTEQTRSESYTVSFVNDNNGSSPGGWMERTGLDLMKIPAFHVLSWCFFLMDALHLVVVANITTMAASFGHDKLAITLPIWGPIAALIAGLTVGFISDLTMKYMSRLVYVFVGNSLQTLFVILSIFWGDAFSIFMGLVLSTYINNGFVFSVIPTLFSEYFDTHHFVRNWGAVLFIDSLLSLLLGVLVGIFYENAIPDGGHECYGLACFRSTFLIGSVMGVLAAFLCGMMWYIEHIKARQRGYESEQIKD